MITHTNTSGASREKSEQECDALPSCANTLPPKADSDGADEDDGDDDETEDDDDDNEVTDPPASGSGSPRPWARRSPGWSRGRTRD